ncbi:aldo/keto reductase [Lutibaculum baratangense]|uniref:Aldo-keto reductase n=1 Tax=Lutibaculum baratangense AMV1 TaxID=631454 RepID=V4QTE1_9HYPH|nr:aldo/keto reductase [Lutibaculum baratangense]ESR23017.1 Aldo-keto reductase [Lutibaculum baratangense AMV1]
MLYRKLGSQGLTVSALGLGCSGMSSDYGVRDDVESTATVHRAIELGVTLFDTSDAYAAGRNEELLGSAIKGRRDGLVIASKFGNIRGPNGERGGTNGHPDYVPQACEKSLARLGVEVIDLYYIHRVDPDVPIEDTVGAMGRLVEEGKVRYLGVCEAGPQTIRRAHATHPLSAVQMEYSLWTRDAEAEILPVLKELGIGLVPYSPLGRGFLTGAFGSRDDLIATDRRHAHPRFQEGNFEKNLALLEPIRDIAAARGATNGQVVLAWLLAQWEGLVPIPGTKRRTYLEENLGALDVTLEPDEIESLSRALPPGAASGLRYPEFQLKKLGI